MRKPFDALGCISMVLIGRDVAVQQEASVCQTDALSQDQGVGAGCNLTG